jgi:hypothetical protein
MGINGRTNYGNKYTPDVTLNLKSWVGTRGGYMKGLVVKSISFWQKYFLSINSVGLRSFSQTFWYVKWDLYEKYGGPNLGEKVFQLFQLL